MAHLVHKVKFKEIYILFYIIDREYIQIENKIIALFWYLIFC